MTPRVLSGIQPTSDSFHVGNHLGALQNWVAMQQTHECVYFIADMHAITVEQDPTTLRQRTLLSYAQLLALGIDPNKSTLIVQSHVPEHAQLMWVMSSITGLGEANRMTQFKDKSAKGGAATASVGLLTYPILQAADILLYGAQIVPVGKDQVQHLEIARDIAEAFNNRGGGSLVVPQSKINEETQYIPGTDGQKMSKSYGNFIDVFLPEKELKDVINKKIVTDPTPLEEPKDAEGSVVFKLYKLIAPANDVATLKGKLEAGGYGWGHAKKDLLEAILVRFAEERKAYDHFMADKQELDRQLHEGADKARITALSTLHEVRRVLGY
jgi:tryptophanyl-tRNA synthetase